MTKIVHRDEKVLHKRSEDVPISDISSARIHNIINDMKKALAVEKDGVAIAAPQIGIPLRIFVVSGDFLEMEKGGRKCDSIKKDLVFINPKITKLSKQKEFMQEGCLSVRWIYGEVKRSKNATISAYDENGKKFTRGAGGLLAQIFQHEIDHLNGILFTEKAQNVREIQPEK